MRSHRLRSELEARTLLRRFEQELLATEMTSVMMAGAELRGDDEGRLYWCFVIGLAAGAAPPSGVVSYEDIPVYFVTMPGFGMLNALGPAHPGVGSTAVGASRQAG